MTFIDRLVEAAREYPQVKRIKVNRYEVVTDPLDARDIEPTPKDRTAGWPAAWAIAKKARISWGCGNHGQHQISVPAHEIEEALPTEYKEGQATIRVAMSNWESARWELEGAIERVKAEAVLTWQATDEAKTLRAKEEELKQACIAASNEAAPAPEWFRGSQWFEVRQQ